MRTIALEVGAGKHIFVHQICSIRFDNALKKIEICMANRQEFVLANATIEAYKDMVGKMVTAMNSTQGVVITGITHPAEPPVANPVDDPVESQDVPNCGSCGEAPAKVDGLCNTCHAKLSEKPQSFEGPQS